MEVITLKRLEAMGSRVREGLDTCKGFLEWSQEDSSGLDKPHRLTVEKFRASVDRLRGEIHNCMMTYNDATPDLEVKIEEFTILQIEAEDLLVEIDLHYSSQQNDNAVTSYPIPPNLSLNTRLPKLEMIKYDGNILRWHEFWDQFSSVIESRQQMSDVDKLTYLSSLVEGDAKRAIEGLDITNSNYKVAVNRLTERFGKKGSLIDAHYTALQHIPKSTRDVNSCRRTLDELERHLRTLQSLGENTEHKQLRATILEKFPDETIFDLRMSMTSDDHSVSEIRNLLEKVIGARESANRMASINKLDKTDATNPNPTYTIEALYTSINDLKRQLTPTASTSGNNSEQTSSQKRKWIPKNKNDNNRQTNKRDMYGNDKRNSKKRRKLHCIFCSGSHIHERCDQFKTTAERKEKLGKRCFLCLRDSHFIAKCPNKSNKCPHCNKEGSHNRCLCPTLDNKTRTNALFSQLQCDTVLQTATIPIENESGMSIKSRLLFDTGSQKTYVRSDVAKQLKLKVIEPTSLTIFTFGSIKPKTITTSIVSLRIHAKGGMVMIQAYTLPTLTGVIPSHFKLRKSIQQSYPSLNIAEDTSHDCAADVIIGNDYYHSIIKGERVEVTPTLYLLDSAIGWIPSGTYTDRGFQHSILSVLTYFQQDAPNLGNKLFPHPDPAIRDDNIKNIWELETIGIKDSPKVLEDDEVVQFFNDTTTFEDGRYQVRWPWTQYPPELPVNFGLALGRLKSLIRRSDNDTLTKYNEVIQDQLNKGIVEVVSESRLPGTHPVHYLPHHCVLQPHKTTKLRIVYDGSAKTKGQLSLNEYLYKGPLLLEDLTLLLLRFRQYPIGIVADIEKAFLQIGLQTKDRDVTRFLWVEDVQKEPSDGNLIHLRFCRVPFGIISSPFLLAATVRKHLLQNNHSMTKKVAECLYVDNLVTGVNTDEEAKSLFQQTRKSFEDLSMNIREWNSNSHAFLDSIPKEARFDDTTVSVLGLIWDTIEDKLSIAIQCAAIDRKATTKRDILRIIASVFDPCGFTAPLTLPTRLLLQDLWKEKIKWDTPLPPTLIEQWEHCKTFLKGVPAVSIPRYHFPGLIKSPKDWSYQLHCFTDASKDAYIAVVYLRASKHDQHLTSLMISRSRLTPLKRKECFTIPKLELLAVVIGTRLLGYVLRSMEIKIEKTFLWTDSQVVLGWLRSERLLPPFVARRVAEVRKADTVQFRYVQSALNPADVATRQIAGSSLPDLWVHGPGFLTLSCHCWPTNEIPHFALQETDEHNQMDSQAVDPSVMDGTSCQTQMVHTNTTAYKLPSNTIIIPSPQTVAIQTEYYPNEQRGNITPLARSLGLYHDEEGVLRCKGRFANAEFPMDQKYPILLPKLAPITSDIIKQIHESNHHVGVLHTLSLLRRTYWVPQGRSLVAKILHRCATCTKYGGGPYQLPGMPALPSERVTFSLPFSNTGLDYFGPLTTTENGIPKKRWACIFTCMAIRAIHIELVDDCSTEEFLLAFRRFSATRGKPKLVVSDNAAHFKLAASTLDTFADNTHGTRWKFIPALSPWFGGFYERMVGLVKNCLRRTLDQSLLTDGQLRTVLHEIAATLNTRPLTAVSGDPEIILTPAHFLSTCGPSVIHLTQPITTADTSLVRAHLLGSWKKTDSLLKQFGVMFQTHYLTSLRERHQLEHKQPRIVSHRDPRVGDKVQIKGDSKNRVHWKVGTITSILNSADGAIRTAGVTLTDGTILNRSIGHLYPLEMDIVDPPPTGPSQAASPEYTAAALDTDTLSAPQAPQPTAPHTNSSSLSDSPRRPPLDLRATQVGESPRQPIGPRPPGPPERQHAVLSKTYAIGRGPCSLWHALHTSPHERHLGSLLLYFPFILFSFISWIIHGSVF